MDCVCHLRVHGTVTIRFALQNITIVERYSQVATGFAFLASLYIVFKTCVYMLDWFTYKVDCLANDMQLQVQSFLNATYNNAASATEQYVLVMASAALNRFLHISLHVLPKEQ